MNILRCADEASNASDDPAVQCNTDIYTTKEMKQQPVNQGYFSFLKSFISVEHDSIMKEREGIIVVSLDGVFEEEMIQLFVEMKKRNDRGVRDVTDGSVFKCRWYSYHISLECKQELLIVYWMFV